MPAMIGQLRVRNWSEFQHYKDRNPPWIKLHFALLASEDWVTLDDASKLLAIVCMLVASRNNGMIPNNPAYLKRVAYLDKLPKLKPLIDCGFLEIPQADASTLQANDSTAQALARPETETDTDTDKKEEPNGSLSETSSDDAGKSKKKPAYPPVFESFWLDYPRTPNMSKTKAFAAWRKLPGEDQASCHRALPAYKAYLAAKPDHPVMHATTFISERRFDGFLEQATASAAKPVTEGDWNKRLTFARDKHQWHLEAWGPFPGADGCKVPGHLLQPNDGHGWAEWEA
ncbi:MULTISPECIES: hypothetical protein [unclassified Mesorhizobium]|uniref:hypothetical protein n=1 Tax=unclassified Mesorhizobium TaxID=325217 RepID=UPI0030148DAA